VEEKRNSGGWWSALEGEDRTRVEWGEQTGFVAAAGKNIANARSKAGRVSLGMQVNVGLRGRSGKRRPGKIQNLMIDMCVGATEVGDKRDAGTRRET
jgi:hypothetical protein